MAGEIQLNSTTMATESSGSITAQLDTIRPNTTNGSLTLQGDSSDAGVTGLTIDSSGVVNTTTAKVTNIQATSGQSLTIKDEDGNTAITVGTDNTAASYLSLNFGSYHGDSGGAGSGTLTGNTLSDYEEGTFLPTIYGSTTSGTYTPSNVKAYYRKIGTQVTVWCEFQLSAASGGVGSVRFGGLPFSYQNSMGINPGGLWLDTVNTTSSSSIGSAVLVAKSTADTVIYPVLIQDNSSVEQIPITGVTTSSKIGFVLTYITV